MSIIYKAKRIGQYGQVFTLFKFRTMEEKADAPGGSSTADDDCRITKIGKILRKTKLDELPQFINYFRGDIGIIGWRPEAPEYLFTIPQEILQTKPGIIGLATLWDIDEGAMLKGKSNPDEYYEKYILPEKRRLELYYVQHKSFKLDCYILWNTIKRLLGMRVNFHNMTKYGRPNKKI